MEQVEVSPDLWYHQKDFPTAVRTGAVIREISADLDKLVGRCKPGNVIFLPRDCDLACGLAYKTSERCTE